MEIFPTLSDFILTQKGMKYRYYQMKTFYDPEDPFYEKTHFHSAYEIYINMEGKVSFLVNNQIYPISKGDIIVCHPGELHNCIYTGATIHEYRCVWIYFDPDSEYDILFKKENFKHKYSFDEAINKKIDILLSSFPESSVSEQKILIKNFLSLLFENKNHAEQSLAPIPKPLKAAMDYISKNFAEIKSMADVAEQCYISVPTLNRLFKKHLSTTPSDFLNLKKLTVAKNLLEDGNTVMDACVQAGFSNCSYFIALFKKQYGTTPHKFKATKG